MSKLIIDELFYICENKYYISDHKEKIKNILESNNININNITDNDGDYLISLLMNVYVNDKDFSIETIKFFIKNNFKIDYRFLRGILCNIENITFSPLKIIKFICENKVDINSKDKYNRTHLLLTRYINNSNYFFEVVDYLIKNKADVNVKDYDSNSISNIIPRSVYNDEIIFPKLIKLLCEAKANIDAIDKYGHNLLEEVFYSKIDCSLKNNIKCLLDNKTNINFQDKYLRSFIFCINFDKIKFCIENKIDINLKDENGNTALISHIIKNGNIDIIKLLIDNSNINDDLIVEIIKKCKNLFLLKTIIFYLIDKNIKLSICVINELNNKEIVKIILNYYEEKQHSNLLNTIYIN